MAASPPLADVTALAAWVGETIPGDDARAVAVLRSASNRVRELALEHGATQDAVDGWTGDAIPEAVSEVVVQVAARVWSNPRAATAWTKGPFSEQYEAEVARGLYLDTDQLARIRQAAGLGTKLPRGLGTVSTTRGDLCSDTIFLPTAPPPSGQGFPWYNADDDIPGL